MNELMVINDFDTTQRVSMALFKSGYFFDVQSEAQAIVKVLAGQELGLPPFAAMAGIHIIKGKPVLGANAIATLIKNDPRYDYRIEDISDSGCIISFFENGKKVGISAFTAEDAKKAQLGGVNWQKFPRNMYFARAISNGAKWYTPGIFGGAPVYTPDELGADVNEDGDIIDVTPGGPEWPDDDKEPAPSDNSQGPDKVEPVKAENGNGQKVMAAVKYVGWLTGELGFKDDQHTRMTVKLLTSTTAVPNDLDKRKRLFEALQAYRHLRDDKGLSQDDALVALADEEVA